MNEAERQKYDEAEASGLSPRLRSVVQSFCAPIWWEIDGKTILDNGSMCVIATPQSVFGVTANHVLTIYERHKVAHPDAFCQLGSAPFDPIPNLIARSEHWDLATFRIPDFTLKHWGRHHRIYKTEAWPPPAIKKDDPVILGGYPTNRRTQASGKRPFFAFSLSISRPRDTCHSTSDGAHGFTLVLLRISLLVFLAWIAHAIQGC